MKIYKKKLVLRKSVKFAILQFAIIALSTILLGFAIKDASQSLLNYRINGLLILIEVVICILVLCLEDFRK